MHVLGYIFTPTYMVNNRQIYIQYHSLISLSMRNNCTREPLLLCACNSRYMQCVHVAHACVALFKCVHCTLQCSPNTRVSLYTLIHACTCIYDVCLVKSIMCMQKYNTCLVKSIIYETRFHALFIN